VYEKPTFTFEKGRVKLEKKAAMPILMFLNDIKLFPISHEMAKILLKDEISMRKTSEFLD